MINNQDPISELISRYKDYKRKNGHEDEFYKYEAIQHFQDHWNLEKEDFAKMMKNAMSKQQNLMFNLAVRPSIILQKTTLKKQKSFLIIFLMNRRFCKQEYRNFKKELTH